MPDQIGYFASLKNAAGKVFSYLASITLTGTDGKTLTVNESLTFNAADAGALRVATAANTIGNLAVGATTEILVGGGAGVVPVWTTVTGTGAPVRATSPTLVTPALGTPASGVLTNCTGLPTVGLASQVFAAGIGVGGAAAGTGGIAFPASAVAVADANTLDDYEEGTWTPAIANSGASVASSGIYTKIGNVVLFSGEINTIGNTAGASNRTITGLPFAASAFSVHAITMGESSFVNYPATALELTGYIAGGASAISMVWNTDDGAFIVVQGTDIDNANAGLVFSGVYRI